MSNKIQRSWSFVWDIYLQKSRQGQVPRKNRQGEFCDILNIYIFFKCIFGAYSCRTLHMFFFLILLNWVEHPAESIPYIDTRPRELRFKNMRSSELLTVFRMFSVAHLQGDEMKL